MPTTSATRPNCGCSSGTVSPRASTRGSRTASRGERTSAAGTPCRSSSGSSSAVGSVRVNVSMCAFISSTCATRASRVAKRGSCFELGVPDGGEHAAGELLGRRADRHVAVGRLVDAERRQARDHAAGALRQAARLEQVERLGRDERRQDAEHRDVHVLAGAGGFALPQRRENADDAEDRRDQIRHRHADADRRIPGRARRHHQAAQRLDDGVHRLAGARVPGRAEAGNRAVDHARIDRPRERIADAEPVERARAEVLDDDVGLAQQVGEHVARAGLLQVERDAVLAAKPVQRRHRDIVGSRAAERRRRRARGRAGSAGTDRATRDSRS